mgnify:CR=1 FL=1
MNPSIVISQIDNLPNIGAEEYALLSDLSEKYPWFSAVHILQAKCLSNQNKYGFKQALKKAAIYTGDREVLYDIINTVPIVEIPDEKEIVEKPKPVEEQTDNAAVIEKDKNVDTLEIEESIKPVDNQTEKVIEKEDESQSEVDAPVETTPSVSLPEPTYDPTVELQKFIIKDEPKLPLKKDVASHVESPPKLEPLVSNEKLDFLSWLDEFKETDKEEAKPRRLPMSDEAKALLDNFIKNRPSVKRMKKEFYNPETYVQRSVEEESDLVSETLASLFLKQELPLKAIDVYQKLQLQNPQKFSYFAALIEKVKVDHNLT